jgi:sulfite reductase (NADPH) hemoprotein beta-component
MPDIINIGKLLMIESAAQVKLSRNEGLKQTHPALAGSIASTLHNADVDRFSDDDYEFLKFHGIYQQDDRDLRKTGKKYIFMVRGRLPGGLVGPTQYLVFDDLASRYGNDTSAHHFASGISVSRSGQDRFGAVDEGNQRFALATTLAACGDVNRNVMAPPTPIMNSPR